MAGNEKQKKSWFQKCMSGTESGFDCAAMMECCSAMMKGKPGTESPKAEEDVSKA